MSADLMENAQLNGYAFPSGALRAVAADRIRYRERRLR